MTKKQMFLRFLRSAVPPCDPDPSAPSVISGATLIVTACLLGLSMAVYSQAPTGAPPGPRQRPPASGYPKAAPFPSEDRVAVSKYLSEARKIAGGELFSDLAHRCIFTSVYRERVNGIQYNGIIEPAKLFDNLYAVGQVAVSSHALVTSQGIVIFDSLNNEDEAKNILVPNLVKLGLDPANIKYVVITHEHGDHFGGSRYLQKTYGAKVVASAMAWNSMSPAVGGPGRGGALQPPPDRDVAIADGEVLKVGDTELQFYVTPGHTNGVLSTIFKVTDRGVPHTVGYFGGTGGGGSSESNLRNHIGSLERWRRLTAAAKVDVLIANHPLHDRAVENNDLVRYALPGDPNPYILGTALYDRYIQLQAACAKVQMARLGLKP